MPPMKLEVWLDCFFGAGVAAGGGAAGGGVGVGAGAEEPPPPKAAPARPPRAVAAMVKGSTEHQRGSTEWSRIHSLLAIGIIFVLGGCYWRMGVVTTSISIAVKRAPKSKSKSVKRVKVQVWIILKEVLLRG